MLPPSLQTCAISKSCSFDYSWLMQERMSSYSTTTEPLSRLWSRWWGRNGTGWMRTALSCTTSTWSSSWPCAQRERTSTRRSSATPCSRWMTLSAWWPTRTASLRWATLSPVWVGPAHVSPRGVWGWGRRGVFRWPRWDLTVLTPAAHFVVRFALAETASSWALVLGERNDGGVNFSVCLLEEEWETAGGLQLCVMNDSTCWAKSMDLNEPLRNEKNGALRYSSYQM